MIKTWFKPLLGAMLGLLMAVPAWADQVHVAVAANFTAPARALAAVLEKSTGHKVVLSFGATGKFYAQIQSGAPFDVLLAADAATPEKLEREGLAVAGSRFTYATGQLVLWSANPALVDAQGAVLKTDNYKKLSIAAPKFAPYGAAAVETLNKMGIYDQVQPRLVTGESIGQAYSFVASGNAELGFVALSQVMEGGRLAGGSAWIVPGNLHAPIVQDAVLLQRAANNPAAKAWLHLLRADSVKPLLRSYGYKL